ncbi:hypothetical protein VTJ49DRAFT_4402 [Mycothermus thermophilus]|uniref:HAUS augmin-like complex subunit 6 N-terminal domain-containing protein n=1 Tax=Humicola insolens TaxID=85995 RepID=A0ABR3V5G6_HUMIN
MSSHTRTRSLRAPTSVSKSAQRSTHQGQGKEPKREPTSTAVSTTTATTTTTTAASAANAIAPPTSPSNISLFLTNLRLLDLDLRPDWPDITPSIFTNTSHSARNATQDNHKTRVQAVEWALYHLFALWDPDDTRARLQPLFPPADQGQSLALRAGLLRGLEQAKKAGVLGRDAVVRKTMLDECKGERLEEVLAAFSSAVLKKVVADRQRRLQRKYGKQHRPALAQTLALENMGYTGDRTELVALILAHRVSLSRGLRNKEAARARFVEFADVLAAKEQALLRRKEAASAAKRDANRLGVTESQKREVWRALRDNWTGSERWMETLVYGDAKARKDGLLTAPYDRVWRRLQSGRLAELEENTSVGLLEQLDGRVQEQKERLAKWRGFRERMFNDAGMIEKEVPDRERKRKGIDLGFTAHSTLHIGDKNPRKNVQRVTPAQPDAHYEALVNGLRSDLARISPAAPVIPAFFRRPRRPVEEPQEPEEAEPEVISELGDLEEGTPPLRPTPTRREPIRVSEEPAFEPMLRKAKSFYKDPAVPDEVDEPLTPSRRRRSGTTALPHRSQPTRQRLSHDFSAPTTSGDNYTSTSPPQSKPKSGSKSRPGRQRPPSPPDEDDIQPSPPSPTEQQLADKILASVNAASPSPARKVRHRLSLAERTILSIARRTSQASLRAEAEEDGFDFGGEDEVGYVVQDGTPSNRKDRGRDNTRKPRNSFVRDDYGEDIGYNNNNNNNDDDERPTYEDLTSRTRRSMAGTEEARRKAQVERRRSMRKTSNQLDIRGSFPRVDEEREEKGGDTTLLLAEELIRKGHDQDYEAVFMSRPKIKMSPVLTPVRGVWD